MRCDECGTFLYAAGQEVRAGTYVRIDDDSGRSITLAQDGVLPPTFDGHVALYREAQAPCPCVRRAALVIARMPSSSAATSPERPVG
jgi:hypothetical protein